MRLTVDSSVFVSALRSDERESPVSNRFFHLIRSGESFDIILPWLVPVEIVNVMGVRADFSESRLREILGALTQDPKIKIIAPADLALAENLALVGRLCLKTADFIVALTAFVTRSVLVSWDRGLLKAYERIGEARTPGQILKSAPGE